MSAPMHEERPVQDDLFEWARRNAKEIGHNDALLIDLDGRIAEMKDRLHECGEHAEVENCRDKIAERKKELLADDGHLAKWNAALKKHRADLKATHVHKSLDEARARRKVLLDVVAVARAAVVNALAQGRVPPRDVLEVETGVEADDGDES